MVTRSARRLRALPRHDLALLPLRLFLGGTYAYAGLQKLANPTYLDPRATSGVAAQMRDAAGASPIGGVIRMSSHHAILLGLVIALGELAVGLGTLLGLWTRVAAVGGMALALSFLLTVSWHTSPYYFGADIVFLVAFTPLALVGGGRWTVDGLIARRARRSMGLDEAQSVPVAFALVRKMCGAFEDGGCRLRRDHRCESVGCPVLRASAAAVEAEPIDLRRRRFLETARTAAGVAVIGLVGSGTAAGLGRLLHDDAASSGAALQPLAPPKRARASGTSATGSTTSPAPPASSTSAPSTAPGTSAPPRTQPSTSPSTTPAGTAIGRSASVPVGGAASFVDPATGERSIVVQPTAGVFEACSAICTHQGCTVAYDAGQRVLHCPCHGAEFDPADGRVLRGPARQPLATVTIRSASDGNLYVDG
ncbi:MAG TPA: TQO small subunit DoxD [Acidimicrobiales bacterium]